MVCGVQPLDMIAFEEGVDEQLPVGGDVMRPAAVEVELAQAERVEIGRQRHGVGEIGLIVLAPTRSARRPRRREIHEAVRRLVETGEAVGARHAGQLAVGLVGPGVIGADDPLGRRRPHRCRSAACRDGGRRWRRHAPCRHRRASQDQRRAIAVMRHRLAAARAAAPTGRAGAAPCRRSRAAPPRSGRGRCRRWRAASRCRSPSAASPRAKASASARCPGVGRRGVRGMSMVGGGCASRRSVARPNRPFRHESPAFHFHRIKAARLRREYSSRGDMA